MTDLAHFPQLDEHADLYVRRGSAVQGPYPARQIARYLLLGRVRHTDRVSTDGDTWTTIAELPHLIPEEMQDLESDEGRARFIEARMRADERGGDRARRSAKPGGDAGPPKERRRRSGADELNYALWRMRRITGTRRAVRPVHPVFALGGLGFVVLTAGLLFAVLYSSGRSVPQGEPDCDAAAGAGVNWAYCAKNGTRLSGRDMRDALLYSASLRDADLSGARLTRADLSYGKFSDSDFARADLGQARLVGADLQRSRLRDANLRDADLSYANLLGADLADAELAGARLVNAIWINGRECLVGSLGHCVQ